MSRLKATPITINKKQKKIISSYAKKRTAEAHYKERINIILLASKDMENNTIAKKIKINNKTVSK